MISLAPKARRCYQRLGTLANAFAVVTLAGASLCSVVMAAGPDASEYGQPVATDLTLTGPLATHVTRGYAAGECGPSDTDAGKGWYGVWEVEINGTAYSFIIQVVDGFRGPGTTLDGGDVTFTVQDHSQDASALNNVGSPELLPYSSGGQYIKRLTFNSDGTSGTIDLDYGTNAHSDNINGYVMTPVGHLSGSWSCDPLKDAPTSPPMSPRPSPSVNYQGASPATYSFNVPTYGAEYGVVEICGFIHSSQVGFGPLTLRGDGRPFAGDAGPAPPDQCRYNIELDFGSGHGLIRVNPSCDTGMPPSCESAYPIENNGGPIDSELLSSVGQVNQVFVTGRLIIELVAVESKITPAPTTHDVLNIQPAGGGILRLGVARKYFPSLEVYQIIGSSTRLLLQDSERSPNDLFSQSGHVIIH